MEPLMRFKDWVRTTDDAVGAVADACAVEATLGVAGAVSTADGRVHAAGSTANRRVEAAESVVVSSTAAAAVAALAVKDPTATWKNKTVRTMVQSKGSFSGNLLELNGGIPGSQVGRFLRRFLKSSCQS